MGWGFKLSLKVHALINFRYTQLSLSPSTEHYPASYCTYQSSSFYHVNLVSRSYGSMHSSYILIRSSVQTLMGTLGFWYKYIKNAFLIWLNLIIFKWAIITICFLLSMIENMFKSNYISICNICQYYFMFPYVHPNI